MAGVHACAQTEKADHGGAGQLNGAHRLGTDNEERGLLRAGAGRLSGRRANDAGDVAGRKMR